MKRKIWGVLIVLLVVLVVVWWRYRKATITGPGPALVGVRYPGSDRYGEAPSLHELVSEGRLPPVDRRLPENPMVVQPLKATGGYVNSLTTIQMRNDKYYNSRIVYDSGLIVWSPDLSTHIGNIAESWDVSDGGKSFTFHLRKGLRWSDGKPFTSSDIEFVVKDLIQDKSLGLGFPTPWPSFATVEFTAHDADNFTLEFDRPQGNLLSGLASMGGKSLVMFQKDYCSQFHPKYNPNAESDSQKAGLSSLTEYFYTKCSNFFGNLDTDPARPTMNPWVVVEGKRSNAQLWRYKRNPFYFKVDAVGNQLPYAEGIDFYLVDSLEDKMLRAMSGDADFVFPFSMRDKPTLYDQRAHGKYELIEVVRDSGPHLVIGFNRTGPDKALAKLAANKQFRIAASIALNRDEMSKAICNGLCQPLQAAPVKGTPYYDETFATQYTEYDPAKANAMLDKLGLAGRNSDNIRLLPNGEPLAFTLVYYPRDDEVADELEFIQRFWRAVGIKLILRAVDETSFEELMSSGAYNISAMTGPNTLYTYNPWAMVPCDLKGSIYASGWYGYVRNSLENKNGPFVEPDDATKMAIEAYIQMIGTVDETEKAKYLSLIMANAKEQFYLIGTFSDPGQTGVVGKNMMNMPASIVLSWQRGAPANLQPAQWWKTGSVN